MMPRCILFAAFFIAGLPCGNLQSQEAKQTKVPKRNLRTDEPRKLKGKPDGAPDYIPVQRDTDGIHLASTIAKLQQPFDPPRPFLIWALGSSYTNSLGNGDAWKTGIKERFPNAPPVQYRKMVGNSCPWQYLRGWARHLVAPDQPDLVLIYTIGKPDDLEKLIVELRATTTADIIVPSIHWRERGEKAWGKSESGPDQDVAKVRQICSKHDVEFVENRKDWASYLTTNKLPISALLKDAVHQSNYGAQIINQNMLAHLRVRDSYSYDTKSREYIVQPKEDSGGSITVEFTGTRLDLCGTRGPDGGEFDVWIDGVQAEKFDAFSMSYVQPDKDNSRIKFGRSPTVPRDAAPHGIKLGENVVPQDWTIKMTSDKGDYELVGSVTGQDGSGNAFKDFVSLSEQIRIEANQWRRAERNRTGDAFTFSVTRSTQSEVIFSGSFAKPIADSEKIFVVRLAHSLPNKRHVIKLVPQPGNAVAKIRYFKAYRPRGPRGL